MKDDRNSGKVVEFTRGVWPSTMRLDDGTEEVIPGSYTIETAAGQIVGLFGTTLATAQEYKRVADEGFTETELTRIRNKGPFSNDPEVDCDAILSTLRAVEHMFISDLRSYLEDLIQAIVAPEKRDRVTAHLGPEDLLAAIRKAAAGIRTPANLEVAGTLEAFEITGDDERDRGAVEEILDFLAERKVRKMPET